MKKLMVVLLLSVLLLSGCGKKAISSEGQVSLKIKVVDEMSDKVLFDEEVSADKSVKTLADFLENCPKLKVIMDNGEYGKLIVSMLGLKTEDWNSGPWWVYSSSDNKMCKDQGICPAASSLEIMDKESFEFKFTNKF
ncbi:MAG: hypothetical protein WBO70_08535 [Erysipelotrichaceae bacterium]